LRDANELLKQEVQKLKEEVCLVLYFFFLKQLKLRVKKESLCLPMNQVNSLRQQREQQDTELQKSEAKANEAVSLAAEEVSKSKAAKEVIKSLTAQVIFRI
jgi:hypothetical protein